MQGQHGLLMLLGFEGHDTCLGEPRYKYKFGEPKPKAQDNFTDPESRIMKRAGGGFDYCSPQTAIDDTAHIIVTAELTNSGADSR